MASDGSQSELLRAWSADISSSGQHVGRLLGLLIVCSSGQQGS